jgi:hypothetical protein
MPRRLKDRVASDDVFGWVGTALALVAVIVLDKSSAPHKWHAAIMWTFCALFGLLIFGGWPTFAGLVHAKVGYAGCLFVTSLP